MAVTLNAAGTQATSSSASSVTYTGLTIAAGSDLALVWIVAWAADPGAISVNRWDDGASNQNLTAIVSPTADVDGHFVAIYGLVNPAVGNKTLQMTWTTPREFSANAVAWNGAHQTGGTTTFPNSSSATGNIAGASITITLPTNGAAVSVVAGGAGAALSSVSATQLMLYSGAGPNEFGGSRSTASGVMTGTFAGATEWVIAATGVAEPAAAGVTPLVPRRMVTRARRRDTKRRAS